MITILVVDGEPLIRRGLRAWLERVGHATVVGEANNGSEAVALARTLHPDVVVMDISRSAEDGLSAIPSLRAAVPHCAVVLLSLYTDTTLQARARPGLLCWLGSRRGLSRC